MADPIYYSDIDISFTPDDYTSDFKTFYNKDDIKQSIKLLLNTCYGDRLFQPEIGSALRDCLFMQSDEISKEIIQNEISNVIKEYEPRITVQSISSEYDNENMALIVTLKYYINVTNELDEASFKFSRIS